MRFPATCPRCQATFQADYTDLGIHDLKCPQCGGLFTVYLRKHKFEMLFDLGTRALMDGYAREAVSSFAASLERFFEFYTRSAALENAALRGEAFEVAHAKLEKTWRLMSAQSERQMGAFALMYLQREGTPPDFLTPQLLGTEFRNKVIHRGYLPPRSEVEDYAGRIFALIDRLLRELGEAATHAQLEQELTYSRHMQAQGDDVIAVFEEHPGMFRVRRFGGQILPKHSAGKKLPSTPTNDAQGFQAALRERGELLGKVFKGI